MPDMLAGFHEDYARGPGIRDRRLDVQLEMAETVVQRDCGPYRVDLETQLGGRGMLWFNDSVHEVRSHYRPD